MDLAQAHYITHIQLKDQAHKKGLITRSMMRIQQGLK